MLNVKAEDIITKIKEEKALSSEEVEEKINSKIKELSGLISRDGAAHIIANELGIKLFDASKKRYKINQIYGGLKNIEVLGKITKLNDIRNFNVNGREGKVRNFFVGDETGQTRIVLWNDQVDKYQIKEGDIVKVKDSFIKENNLGYKEIHLGNIGILEINPEGEQVNEVKEFQRSESGKKKINELKENDNVGVYGTIVQVFEPKFYAVCPECNKKVENSTCGVHGNVAEKYAAVANFFFDDGTGNIRVVVFRDQVANLYGIDEVKLQELKEDITKFEDYKKILMGKQLVVSGRVVKNQMFDRIEFVANSVEDADPAKLLQELST